MVARILGYAIAATLVSLIASAAGATPIDLSEDKPGSLFRLAPWAIVLDFDDCDWTTSALEECRIGIN